MPSVAQARLELVLILPISTSQVLGLVMCHHTQLKMLLSM